MLHTPILCLCNWPIMQLHGIFHITPLMHSLHGLDLGRKKLQDVVENHDDGKERAIDYCSGHNGSGKVQDLCSELTTTRELEGCYQQDHNLGWCGRFLRWGWASTLGPHTTLSQALETYTCGTDQGQIANYAMSRNQVLSIFSPAARQHWLRAGTDAIKTASCGS